MKLRGVEPNAIYTNYVKGVYSKCKLEGFDRANDNSSLIRLVEANGTSYLSRRYEFIDTSNTKQMIVTTNHENFVNDNNMNKGKQKKVKLICRSCRNDEFKHPPIGRPLMIESNPFNPCIVTITTEGTFCRLECVLEFVQRYNSGGPKLRSINMVDSETIVHVMNDLLYPGTKLKRSMDFWLWDKNGGPLSEEEFFSDSHYYYELPQIIIKHAKVEYMKTLDSRT